MMSFTQGRSPHPISSMSISQRHGGLAPVCPHTLAARSPFTCCRTVQVRVIATHRRCCSPQIPVSPGSHLAGPAASRCPRSSPPLAAPTRRPSRSSPTMLTVTHRRTSQQRGSTPRLAAATPVSIILLLFLSRSRAQETSRRGPPAQPCSVASC
jgi:hypothetical protein